MLALEAALLTTNGGEPTWIVVLFPAIAGLYLIIGIIAWWRRPVNPFGVLLICGGASMAIGGLANVNEPSFVAVGTVFAVLILGIVVHLLHAFPSGRVQDRVGRLTVAAGYLVTLLVYAPQYLFRPGESMQNVVRITASQEAYDLARVVGKLSISLVMLVTALVLARRVREAPPRQRPGLAFVYVSGILAVLALPFAANVLPALLGFDALEVAVTQLTLLALVPPIFGVAMLTGEFGRVRGVETLVEAASAPSASRADLEHALASALGDPSVRLVLGHDAPPPASPTRGTVEVRRDGGVAATIEYDAIHLPDPQSVRPAAALIGVILEREQLAAALRLHQAELERSRERVVAASDVERRRIARDLHDGLQAKLVLLAIHARGVDASGELGREIDAMIDDLRALIGGVMPPVLLERGLATAISELADRAPVPVTLDLQLGDEPTLAPAVETTTYFVAAEALANALKHAAPTRLTISLRRTDGRVRLEVQDDGRGGARIGRGAGLDSLQDRVAALGGEMQVLSADGAGTRVIAEVPCGS